MKQTNEIEQAKRIAGVTTHQKALDRALKFAKKTQDKQLEEVVLDNMPFEKSKLKGLKNKFKYFFTKLNHPAYKTESLKKGDQEQYKKNINTTNHFKVLNKYFEIAKEQNDGLLYKNILNEAKESIKDIEKYEQEANYNCALDAIEDIFPIVEDKKTLITKIEKLKEKEYWKEEIMNTKYNQSLLKEIPTFLDSSFTRYRFGSCDGVISSTIKYVKKYPFLKGLIGKRFPISLFVTGNKMDLGLGMATVIRDLSISEVREENRGTYLRKMANVYVHPSFGTVGYLVKDGIIEQLERAKTSNLLELNDVKTTIKLAKTKNPDYFLDFRCNIESTAGDPWSGQYELNIVNTKGLDLSKVIEG